MEPSGIHLKMSALIMNTESLVKATSLPVTHILYHLEPACMVNSIQTVAFFKINIP